MTLVATDSDSIHITLHLTFYLPIVMFDSYCNSMAVKFFRVTSIMYMFIERARRERHQLSLKITSRASSFGGKKVGKSSADLPLWNCVVIVSLSNPFPAAQILAMSSFLQSIQVSRKS